MKNKIEDFMIYHNKCDKMILYNEMYFLLSDYQLPIILIDKDIMEDIHNIYVKISMGLSKFGIQFGGGVRKFKKVEVLSHLQIKELVREITLTELGIID